MFETEIYHFETRRIKKPKNSADDLDIFVEGKVHSADISRLITSLKRVTEDVKTGKEDKGKNLMHTLVFLFSFCFLFFKLCYVLTQGYTDLEYRKRRAYFADLAYNYRVHLINEVGQTTQLLLSRREVYRKLRSLYPTHACTQYLHAFQQLEKYCGYQEDNIPQLQDVSRFLKETTGFQLRPAAGLLSARDFLASLAFRVFQCTQYIRHFSSPTHSPEPDCCHELLGHVPMLANKEFAQLSKDIGLASLGSSEAEIEKLSTVSTGSSLISVAKPKGSLHIPHCSGNKSVFFPHRNYAVKIKKPFSLCYDPFTSSIEVLDTPQKVKREVSRLKEDLKNLCLSLENLS
uniref:Biopterin-dependent aromatic amino acid hydroxylase family profile domain-containing protein n=1 Tax=Pavo cristatus TaxID=9049 RepID=A0A8C9EGI7_PAVCR